MGAFKRETPGGQHTGSVLRGELVNH